MKNVILTIAFILMTLTIFWMWDQNSELRHDLENINHQPDTVWVNKPFVPKVEFPKMQLPNMVFFYQIDSVPIERIEYVDRVVTIIQKDSVKVEYNELFLTNYPQAPKLLQILSSRDKLSITTFNTDCKLFTEEYQVNYDRYQYNYSDGKLTNKKTSLIKRFDPVVQYTIRPVHNMHDLDLGLKYNTSKFNYEAGLNFNYYPKLRDNLSLDPYIRVSYSFDMARKKTLLEGDTNITPEQLKTLVRVMKDPFFFSTFCYVINPVLGMVKFLLYPFQKAVLYQFMLNRFNIILKFRQAGITELISMYCLWLAMYHPNKKINIISIKDTVAKKVLKKIKFMYKNLPSYLQEPITNGRTGEFGSVSSMEFANGSIIESIPTSDQAGRSESLSLLVIDEAAVVRWASTIWGAAFPTLATGGSAIINSTPYGTGSFFTVLG